MACVHERLMYVEDGSSKYSVMTSVMSLYGVSEPLSARWISECSLSKVRAM